MEDEKGHVKKLNNPNELNKTWYLPSLWDNDKFNMKKKGYILASVIFYHNVLHRLKVLAPKHWWKITLSSRAAKQEKFHKKELFLVFHWNWHPGLLSLKRTCWCYTTAQTGSKRRIVKFPYNHNSQNFIVSEEILPFFPSPIAAPIEEMQWKQRKEYFPHQVTPMKTEQWWFTPHRPKARENKHNSDTVPAQPPSLQWPMDKRCPADQPIYVLPPSKGAAVPFPCTPIADKRLHNQNFPDDSVDAEFVSRAGIYWVRLKE